MSVCCIVALALSVDLVLAAQALRIDFKKKRSVDRQPPFSSAQMCSDDHQWCADWAANGECGLNPGWMLENCRESCGVCPSPTSAPTSAPAPAGSPVEQHGSLRVVDNKIVDAHGSPVRLQGMSFFWSQWMGQYYTEGVVNWLVDDWKCSLVRAALGIHGTAGYLVDPEANKARVELVVNAAIAKGIYVIIDWHDHYADEHVNESMAFFVEMARKYGRLPNVLFEPFNEPLTQSWPDVIKPYHEQLVSVIRAYSDNVIILGTRSFSQDVDEAAANPVSGTNLAYTIHFWAYHHKQEMRDKVSTALSLGTAIFATEWGTCSWGGGLDLAESHTWLLFMEQNYISSANRAVMDKSEDCAALVPGASTDGGWPDEEMTRSGRWVRTYLRDGSVPPTLTPPTPVPTPAPPPPAPAHAPIVPAPAGSPVEQHGALRVVDNKIVGAHGDGKGAGAPGAGGPPK